MPFVDDLTTLLGANVLNGDVLYIGRPGDADPDRSITAAQLAVAMEPRLFDETDAGAFGIALVFGGIQVCFGRANGGARNTAGAGTYADPWRTGQVTWTFPRAFSAAPRVIATPECAMASFPGRHHAISIASISTSAAVLQAAALSSVAGSDNVFFNMVAIGRPS